PTLDKDFEFAEIVSAINSLKFRKASGVDGIQGEHLKYGGRSLMCVITKLFNLIKLHTYVPNIWKQGLVVPLFKGGNKTRKSPDNYRPVTLLSVVYKLMEKVLNARLTTWTTVNHPEFPSSQQQGFQKQLSCTTTAFVLRETVQSCLDNNEKAFLSFLDIRKAFDTVWHSGLMSKLYAFGVTGSVFKLIHCSYQHMRSAVIINGRQSRFVSVERGVRQGGVLSTFLYLLYMNDLSLALETSGFGMKLGHITCSNPTLADDTVLIARSPVLLQRMLDICFAYSTDWKFQYNPTKCSIVIFGMNKTYKSNFDFRLGNAPLKLATEQDHLGMVVSDKLTSSEMVKKAVQKGRKKVFAILGMGDEFLQSNPLVLTHLYKKIVLTSVLYGCEFWNSLSRNDLRSLEVFQHFVCKLFLRLPTRTRSDMCESILGVHRITAEIDKRKLLFLHKLIVLPLNSIPKHMFHLRLFSYIITQKGNGFIPDICDILSRYNLTQYLTSFMETNGFPTKNVWKRIVKNRIRHTENTLLRTRINHDSDFARFRDVHNEYKPLVHWQISKTANDKRKTFLLCKALSQIPQNIHQICEKCDRPFRDTLRHLVTSCPSTHYFRSTFFDFVLNIFGIDTFVMLDELNGEQLLQTWSRNLVAIN
ncbi:RNA-directed DNA polymerase, partial [Solemya elarraichensis gill symbiont]